MSIDSTLSILTAAAAAAAEHIDSRSHARVVGNTSDAELFRRLDAYDFSKPLKVASIVEDLFDLLGRHAVRNDSPRYFGLFNPPPLTSAVAGDLLTAAVNPQLAVYGHAPAAAEIEKRLISLFGSAIWDDKAAAGTFTSGAARLISLRFSPRFGDLMPAGQRTGSTDRAAFPRSMPLANPTLPGSSWHAPPASAPVPYALSRRVPICA